MEYNTVTKIIMGIFAWIDQGVYTLLSWIMQGFFSLASAPNTIFGTDTILDIMFKRFYVLIGIFALFKLAFSMINSITNPDKFTDKEQGFAKIIQRTIIALVMVLALPLVFRTAFNMQDHILEAIPRIILGTGVVDADTYGEAVAASTLKAFINPNPDCSGMEAEEVQNQWALSSPDLAALKDAAKAKCPSTPKTFKYTYNIFISTIAGLVLAFIMLILSIDVASRCFKLLVLELIAPLPIISYIDPKSSKGGMFDSWLKLSVKTYISVFINVAVVYLVLAAVSIGVYSIRDSGYTFPLNVWLTIFLIIGGFLFMLEANKFVNKALGIKDTEKTFGKSLAAGAAMLGGASATVSSVRSSLKASDVNGTNKALAGLKAAGAGLVGGTLGTVTNFSKAAAGKSSNDILLGQMKANATRMSLARQGSTWLGGALSSLSEFVTGDSEIAMMEEKWKMLEEELKRDEQLNNERKVSMDRAKSKGVESYKTKASINGFTGATGRKYYMEANYAKFNSIMNSAKTRGARDFDFTDETGRTFNIKMDDADMLAHEIQEGNIANYYEQSIAGTIKDDVIIGANSRYSSSGNGGLESSFGDLKANYGKANDDISTKKLDISNQKTSQEFRRKQANAKRNQGGK